jgi:hypothetical protein
MIRSLIRGRRGYRYHQPRRHHLSVVRRASARSGPPRCGIFQPLMGWATARGASIASVSGSRTVSIQPRRCGKRCPAWHASASRDLRVHGLVPSWSATRTDRVLRDAGVCRGHLGGVDCPYRGTPYSRWSLVCWRRRWRRCYALPDGGGNHRRRCGLRDTWCRLQSIVVESGRRRLAVIDLLLSGRPLGTLSAASVAGNARPSIYYRALGSISSACIRRFNAGSPCRRGEHRFHRPRCVMDEIWKGRLYTVPFLRWHVAPDHVS